MATFNSTGPVGAGFDGASGVEGVDGVFGVVAAGVDAQPIATRLMTSNIPNVLNNIFFFT